MTKWIGYGLAAAMLALTAAPAAADWPNDKPIKFIIPYSPGGGFDTIVRKFAPALEKVLGAEVVPENLPGAGGTKGAATVARAEPDGYTIGIFNIPGFTVNQVIGKDMGFDLSEITWIATLATSRYGIAVKADSPISSFKDLCSLGREVKMSDTGASSTSSLAAKLSFSMIGCPLVNVTGYKGSNETMIAVMRGEVDATLKPISSLKKYVDSGDLRMLVTYTANDVLEGVDSTGSLGHEKMADFNVQRVIAAPPGLPADIQKRLSDAFIEAANQADVKEWAEGAKVDLDPIGGEETAKMMSDLATFYSGYKDLLMSK